MRTCVIFVCISVGMLGCKSDKPPAPSAATLPVAAEISASKKAENASQAEKSLEKAAPKIALKARAESASGEEGTPKTFDLSIGIAMDNAASGTATVGGDTLQLAGALGDGNLRLWAVGTEQTSLKGGFFEGVLKDGAAFGTFALSGSGGMPQLRGTWKTL